MTATALALLETLRRRHEGRLFSLGVFISAEEDGADAIVVEHGHLGVAHSAVEELYRGAVATLSDRRAGRARVESAAFAAILVNPDYSPAWLVRRRLVEGGGLDEWRRELEHNALLLTRAFKCREGWMLRRWLLARIFPGGDVAALPPCALSAEQQLCERVAGAPSGTYYAWLHRLRLIPQLSAEQLRTEERRASRWLCENAPRDCSAWHFRRALWAALGPPPPAPPHEQEDALLEEVEARFGRSQCTANHRRALAAASAQPSISTADASPRQAAIKRLL